MGERSINLGKKVIFVDFSHLARRAFHVAEESLGLSNGTTYSVLNMLRKVKILYPDHRIVCVFDGKSSTRLIRKHVFPSYKESRFRPLGASGALINSSFYPQINFLYYFLGCLDIWCMRSDIFEADVVIASQVSEKTVNRLSVFCGHSDSLVLSGDKDYIPMVREGVSWLRPTTKKGVKNLLINYTSKTVLSEFGVSPNLWPYVKILLGDPSDGVPGVKGYGKVKSLKTIIELYRSGINPKTKYQFLKVISQNVGVDYSILFPKFILFDMSCPSLLVNYVTSRTGEVSMPDMLSVKSPQKSRSVFRNTCRKFKFESILTDFSDWVSVFNL